MFVLFPMVASAADLHIELKTADGISESGTWVPTETFSKKYGPVHTKSNGSAVYTITVPNAVFDPLDNAYVVDLSICVEWSRKGKTERLCQKDDLPAPAESAGPASHEVTVKSKIDFDWTVSLWYTGDPPAPIGLPAPPPETEEEL